MVITVVAASGPRILASSGMRRSVSSTTRIGDAPDTMRTVSSGSSLSTVPTPTSTVSHAARSACDTPRSGSPLIHFESPVDVAMRPSSVCAYLSTTNGRSWRGRTSPSNAIDVDRGVQRQRWFDLLVRLHPPTGRAHVVHALAPWC